MTETTTIPELVWTLAGLLGLWAAGLLWRRTDQHVRVAEAWRDDAAGTPERLDAETALVVSRDRRERNAGLVVVQVVFLLVGVAASLYTMTPEWFRTASPLAFVAAQVILVASAWRSVRAGDRAMRLLMRGRRTEPEARP